MERNNLATASPNSSQASPTDGYRVSLKEGLSGGTSNTLEFPAVKRYFDAELVVSLGPDGQPLSRYGDSLWNLRSMSTDGQTASYMSFLETQSPSPPLQTGGLDLVALIREQQKALLWLHMDAGRQRAQKTTRQAGRTLNQLARGAHRRGISLFELFGDPLALSEESAELSFGYGSSAQAMLRTLWRHRDFLEIDMEFRVKDVVALVKNSAQDAAECSQTPIIPSRIYCAILARLLSGLDQIERDLEPVLDAYRRERSCTVNAPKDLAGNALYKHRGTQLGDVREAMRARGWSGGSLKHFVASEIIGIQLQLINVVIALTGMRIAEALILPLNGVLEQVEHRGMVHHVVNGYSHKLNRGRKKPASWVTTSEGHRAIILAQKIGSVILALAGRQSKDNDDALLFGSIANPYKKLSMTSLYSRMHVDLIPDICPVITQADIDELNAMELERSWLRDGIEVGKAWPLRFHQYRRSLSVYAHRSGMVSLPALKGQLQHITDEMRAYYSDGFCRAVNLVFDKEHFSHDWNAAKSESSFLAYSLALLFSDEDLIGGIAGRGAARMQEAISNKPKKETLKLFRDGKLAYRETVLGGCIAVDACNQTPLEPIPWDCVEKNCTNAVVFGNRLRLLIKTQEMVVATLASTESGSVEHRLETGHLQVLLRARERFTEAV